MAIQQTPIPLPMGDAKVERDAFLALPEGSLIESKPESVSKESGKKPTTYFRVTIRSRADGGEEAVCVDTGSSECLVSREWVRAWARNPPFQNIEPEDIRGIQGIVQVSQRVTFDFYMEGWTYGKRVIGHYQVITRLEGSVKAGNLGGSGGRELLSLANLLRFHILSGFFASLASWAVLLQALVLSP